MAILTVFSGSANKVLAAEVTDILNINLGKASLSHFSDGETHVNLEENVRGKEIFIIQSTSYPTNDNLMELMLLSDALLRSSAARITAVIPYLGYARQDRRVKSTRVAISAKVIANMLSGVGINRLVTVDLHAEQIQGFFDIPVDNIYASPVLIDDIKKQPWCSNLVVVSPDIGGVVRARAIAKQLSDADLAIIDKRRTGMNQTKVMNIIGNVKNKVCVLVDDIVDTAGTLCKAADELKEQGAGLVVAYVTHPVLSGEATKNVTSSALDKLVVTDTIPLSEEAKQCAKIKTLSLSQLLAESIDRIYNNQSVSELF